MLNSWMKGKAFSWGFAHNNGIEVGFSFGWLVVVVRPFSFPWWRWQWGLITEEGQIPFYYTNKCIHTDDDDDTAAGGGVEFLEFCMLVMMMMILLLLLLWV
jgi:hypothetical protein